MNPYLFAAAVAVLAGAGGYLKGIRQHVAEEAQATWVHELTAATPLLAIEAAPEPGPATTDAGLPVRVPAAEPDPEYLVDEEFMTRLLAFLEQPETALTVALEDTDYWAPIAAGMGPVPVEPELVGVG